MGDTALHKAALVDNPQAISALTKGGADTEARDGGYNTPLHMAALVGNTRATATLLAEGADDRTKK